MDRNRLLITGTGVVVFLAAVTALGIFWFYPRPGQDVPREAMSRVEFDPFIQADSTAGDTDAAEDAHAADDTDIADDTAIGDEILPGEHEISEDGITVVFGTRERDTYLRGRPLQETEGAAAVEESPVSETATEPRRDSDPVQSERDLSAPRATPEASERAAEPQQPQPDTPPAGAVATDSRPERTPAASAGTGQTEPSRRASQEYWIQVFSGSSRSSAESAKNRFGEETSMQPLMTTIDHDGQLYYRLRVGPYHERDAAEALAARLSEGSSFSGAYVSVVYN